MDAKCATCLRGDCKLRRCAQCSLVQYCSKDCQKTHWKQGHKESCKKNTDCVRVVLHEQTKAEVKALSQHSLLASGLKDNVPHQIFDKKLLPEERHEKAVKFSNASKKTRKKQPGDTASAKDAWLRAVATSGLVVSHIHDNEWLPAQKALKDFFRFHEIFEGTVFTRQEHDCWQVDCYVNAMKKNGHMVTQQLLNAENEAGRIRVDSMAASPEKTERAYLLVTNVELEQETYAPMGNVFMRANLKFCVQVCIKTVVMLVNLGNSPAHGIDPPKSLHLIEKQLCSALALLADNKKQYSERREQKKELDRLQAEVNFRKITGWFK